MANARKTVNLDVLLYHANFALRNPELSQEEKSGICGMIETALCAANAYKGFHYCNCTTGDLWGNYDPAREYDRQYHGNQATPSHA